VLPYDRIGKTVLFANLIEIPTGSRKALKGFFGVFLFGGVGMGDGVNGFVSVKIVIHGEPHPAPVLFCFA
jgi:hypothetical protein